MKLTSREQNSQISIYDVDLNPMTLILKRDLDMLNFLCQFIQNLEPEPKHTDSEIERQTDTQIQRKNYQFKTNLFEVTTTNYL